MDHWRLASTGDGNEQGFVRAKNVMGDEQLEVGNIVGKRKRWRK